MCKECVAEIQKLDAVKDRALLTELAKKYDQAYTIAILLKPEDFEKTAGEEEITFEEFVENPKMNLVAVIEKLGLRPSPTQGLLTVTNILQTSKDKIDATLKARELEKKIKETFPNARVAFF